MGEIRPFTLSVPQDALDDLKLRLDRTRWPDTETVDDWSQGAPLERVKALCDYWKQDYDWRRCEALLNGLGQFVTEIDGLNVHFLHIRSPHDDALPLLITHGWPGSIIEFVKVIGPLTDPVTHGGKKEDAFHLVLPSLPGYGFSEKPRESGWGMPRIAATWATLMSRLGYDRYVAQGGDWGAGVTTVMGVMKPVGLRAIHVTLPLVLPDPIPSVLSPEESRMLADLAHYQRWDSGYSTQQMTRPQTLGFGLADSPAGQAAWIYEKFREWADCDGIPENVFSRDELLDNIMHYWLSNSATSSARLYWESFFDGFKAVKVDIPVGCSIFAKELYRAPRTWAEQSMSQLFYWNELDKGGHFAAFEQPDLFIDEVRNCFRPIRDMTISGEKKRSP